MLEWILIGAVLQTVMVLVGHWVTPVANLFAPFGVGISLIVGLLWARRATDGLVHGLWGGAVVGGACALIGIVISFAMGDVPAPVLLFGTLSSALAGAFGGLLGARFGETTAPTGVAE